MPRTLRTTADLLAAGLAAPHEAPGLDRVAARYAVAIPPALQALLHHPQVARQFVPHPDELHTLPHENPDPIGDGVHSPLPGIVHRYPDRVLLKPLLICPTYCRFCFRREHVGPEGGLLTEAQQEAAVAYVAARPAIREVILTGGDPLMLSPRRLRALLTRLGAIPHVELLRIHTRVPVADPARITGDLADALDHETPLYLAVHANHAAEFTGEAEAALARLARRAVPLLGQSVLLRGVNDSAEELEALFRAMLRARVKPYYLHQLDPAPGTARFHVPIERGRALLAELRGRVTGLAWPTYVQDIEGGHGKVPIGPTYMDPQLPGIIRDPWGAPHVLAQPPCPAPDRSVEARIAQPSRITR